MAKMFISSLNNNLYISSYKLCSSKFFNKVVTTLRNNSVIVYKNVAIGIY